MIDDDRLADVLASLAPLLVVTPEPATSATELPSPELAAGSVPNGLDPAAGSPSRPEPGRRGTDPAASSGTGRRRRRWAVAGVVVALGAGVVSPLGGAVADWLGVGSTSIRVRPDMDEIPADLPGIDIGATPISSRDAETRLGTERFYRLAATDLGSPSGFADVPEGGLLVVWPDRTTLWVHDARMDVSVWLEKLVASDQQVDRVEGLGDDALAVIGDHLLETPHRTVHATTTVLWVHGSTEYRLSGDLAVDTLIALAADLDED